MSSPAIKRKKGTTSASTIPEIVPMESWKPETAPITNLQLKGTVLFASTEDKVIFFDLEVRGKRYPFVYL